jgi:hypothetical protein
MASMACVPLIRLMPSLACQREGFDSGAPQGLGPGHRAPSNSASPSPISTMAMWASGARSPDAPTLPCEGTTGVTPRLISSQMRSATSGRMPESPLASTLARISIMARTTSRASGSPTPAECERITLRCRRSRSAGGMRTSASRPTPVFTA